jgi:hypothetical protein
MSPPLVIFPPGRFARDYRISAAARQCRSGIATARGLRNIGAGRGALGFRI